MTTPSNLELYSPPDGSISLDVKTDDDTVRLTRMQLAELFGRDATVIGRHLAAAQKEELAGDSVSAKFALTAADGKSYHVDHYNLDAVISVGYRVKPAKV